MALLALNVTETGILPRNGGTLADALAKSLRSLPVGAPVVILIHGYRFSWAAAATDPHTHILAEIPTQACWKALSWPTSLGLAGPTPQPGLAIALGWQARGSIWRAYRAAADAGKELAGLIRALRQTHGGPITAMTHSLGARVALSALHDLEGGTLDRIVMLAAAEFQTSSERAMQTPAGRSVEVVNVTSRENDFFDFLLERALGGAPLSTLGQGLPLIADRWLDIALDDPATLNTLRSLGYPVGAADRRICHWSLYLRRGAFGFYRDLLTRPDDLQLSLFRECLGQRISPRWSRVFATQRQNGLASTEQRLT